MEIAPFITIGIVSLLAAMSPGPDFAVVTKNSLFGSRKTGLITAIGVGLGILLHVAYSLIGIGFIISKSILLFSIIKYIGAIYLLYLGYKLLSAKRENQSEITTSSNQVSMSGFAALREGFLTNALNPKATLFFLSIFTQVINPETPLFLQATLGVEVSIIVGVWFTLLALIITYQPIKEMFSKIHFYLMKVMGGALVFLGIKLALATRE